MPEFKNFVIVCGQYGSGKTNLSINLAIEHARAGRRPTLVDLDVVNPFFRSSDYLAVLKQHEIRVISPKFAQTNADIPALSAEINSVFDTPGFTILDAGGSDSGATVLGRFFEKIKHVDYEMLYVVNRYRFFDDTIEDAVTTLKEIEAASRLKATSIVNNSHLKEQTTPQMILDSERFVQRVAGALDLQVKFTTIPRPLADQVEMKNIYPIDVYVRTPWE